MNTQHKNLRSKHQFEDEYNRLCMLQNTCPLKYVKAHLKDNILDFNADRIPMDEWDPLCGALKVNDSLRYIAIQSSWQPLTADGDASKKSISFKKKIPAIRSREATLKLTRSIRDCLTQSTCLDCLILKNLFFREQDIVYLAKGVSASSCLKYLSLEQSHLGDTFFKVLCPALRKSATLLSVNFTDCGLSWKSMEEVAAIIKHQDTQRHGEAWKDSLRYRRPDFDQMQGLRRFTLCDNNIGDYGARILADVLKDDLWLKALDLQHCGISTDGATILKESLTFNRTMMVLDVRRNSQIDYDLLRSIIEQVMINARGEHPEYPWQTSSEKEEKLKSTQKRLPRFNVCRKTQSKIGRSKRRNSMDGGRTTEHYPWRTAERIKSNRYRRKHPMNGAVSEPYTAMQALRTKKTCRSDISCRNGDKPRNNSNSVSSRRGLATNDLRVQDFDDAEYERFELRNDGHDGVQSKQDRLLRNTNRLADTNRFYDTKTGRHTDLKKSNVYVDDTKTDTYLKVINDLRMEVELYREKHEKERLLRLIAEEKVNKLEKEKKRLQQELTDKNVKKGGNKFDKVQLKGNSNVLEDENILESIESSFEQFQQFLDMLKDLGLGDLYNQMQQKQINQKEGAS